MRYGSVCGRLAGLLRVTATRTLQQRGSSSKSQRQEEGEEGGEAAGIASCCCYRSAQLQTAIAVLIKQCRRQASQPGPLSRQPSPVRPSASAAPARPTSRAAPGARPPQRGRWQRGVRRHRPLQRLRPTFNTTAALVARRRACRTALRQARPLAATTSRPYLLRSLIQLLLPRAPDSAMPRCRSYVPG